MDKILGSLGSAGGVVKQVAGVVNDAQCTGWEKKEDINVDGHTVMVEKKLTHEPLLHANRHIRLVDKEDGHAEEASAQDESAAREEASAKMRGYWSQKQQQGQEK